MPKTPKFKTTLAAELPPGDSEQDSAAWYQWLLYSWVKPLLERGMTRLKDNQVMEQSDLLQLPEWEDPVTNARILQELWDEEVEEYHERLRVYHLTAPPPPTTNNNNLPSEDNNKECEPSSHDADEEKEMKEKSGKAEEAAAAPPAEEEEVFLVAPPSLPRALARAFWGRIAIGGVFRLISDGSAFASPFLLQQFIKWMYEPDGEVFVGFMWVMAIVAANVIMSMTLNASSHHTTTAFTRMTTAFPILIYDKVLTLTPDHGMTGHLTTLHSADSQGMMFLGMMFHGLWVAPLLLIGAAIALFYFLGISGVVAVIVLFLTSPVQIILMSKLVGFQLEMVKIQDRRMAAINEALQGIRICKFMCWELRFEERIKKIRVEEVEVMRSLQIYKTLVWFVIGLIPALTIVGVFIMFYYLDGDITTERVLPAIAMINVIRMPVIMMPMSLGALVSSTVSLGRIRRFLMKPDIVEYIQTDGEPNTLSMDNISILPPLSGDTPIIQNISFAVSSGDFTIMHGPTGCGKSTLVKTLIGEGRLSEDSGAVKCCGSVAYISQEAWIMNATVQSNIIMGLPLDEDLYNRVVDACQLRDDFDQLAQGDQTEIGERGVNLSGGQKQRVAFARAAYSNRDIVIMDDPLSAVDAHVSKALVEDCILKLMAGKTRLLVTHQIQYLCHCQHVIEMGDKCIIYAGKPQEDVVNAAREAEAKAIQEVETAKRLEAEKKHQEAMERGDVFAPTTTSPKSHPVSPLLSLGTTIQDVVGNDEDDNIAGTLASAKNKTDETTTTDEKEVKGLMTNETTIVGGVSWGVYGWYVRLGSVRWAILTLFVGALWRTSTTLGDLWLSWWSGRISIFGTTYTSLEYMTYFAICVGAGVFLNAIWQFFLAFFVLDVSENSHNAMISRVLRAPTSFFDTTPMGRILNRFSKDMNSLDNVISDGLRSVLNMLLVLLGTIAVVIYTSPYILIIIPFLLLMMRSVYRTYVSTVRSLKQLDATLRSPMMAILNETLGGLSTIRAYAMTSHFRTTHVLRAQAAAVPAYCTRCCQRWLSTHTEAVGNLALFAVVYVGALTITIGDGGIGITPPVISLAITYVTATIGSITYLSRVLADFEADMSSTERIREYSTKIAVERDVVYGDGESPSSSVRPPRRPPTSWPKSGDIVLKDVQLKYRPELQLVLKGVSVSIAGGSKVGIVGRTGSGKSTLILSIFRMIELHAGSITLDGFDIANVSLHDLRNRITIIPQEPVLFTGTLRSNIDPFDDHSDADIWTVLAKCRMKTRIEEESNGLNSPVDERGGNFSVGQRQLLCLARAMLKRCKVLLLDEATASVDFEVDAFIQETIRTEFKACTVLTIAHRLETVIDADKVMVMANGYLEEFGHPSLLIDADSDNSINDKIVAAEGDIVTGTFAGMLAALGEEKCAALKRRVRGATTADQ